MVTERVWREWGLWYLPSLMPPSWCASLRRENTQDQHNSTTVIMGSHAPPARQLQHGLFDCCAHGAGPCECVCLCIQVL